MPLANAVAIAQSDTAFIQAIAASIVVCLGVHRVDAQGGALAGANVEIASDAAVLVAAQRGAHLMIGIDGRLLADLIGRATCGASTKEH